MRIQLVTILLLLSFHSVSQVEDIAYGPQYLLTYDEAGNNDFVGKFFSCFTYDTVGTIVFTKVSGSDAFAIEYETGMIYVNDSSQLVAGKDTICIQVCDGGHCGTYHAVITVVASENCVFINPEADSGGDGTYSNPHDSWIRIEPGTFEAGHAYLQKRGTVDIRNVNGAPVAIRNSQGTPEQHISLGAYGTGANPVVINGNESANAIVFGNFLAEGAKYVDVYNFEFRDCQGIMVESSSYNENLMLTDIVVSNCSNNANIYLKEPYPNDFYDMDISLYNIVSFHPKTSHCIKTNRDVDIVNAHVYGAKRHGVSFHDKCNLRYVYAHNNNTYGLEFQGDSSTTVKCVVSRNSDGIQFDQDSWDHNMVDSCFIFRNSDDGVEIQGTDNVTITNNHIYDNFGDGITIRSYSDSIFISKNKLFNNQENGVHIYEYVGYGLKTIVVDRNIFYGNKKSVLAEEGRHIFVYNNTCYKEGIDESTSGYLVAQNNILGSITGSWVATNNLLTMDGAIFKDTATFDFHLVSTAAGAIDQGTDIGFNSDFEGTPVPYGNAPDIGAFEFTGIINTIAANTSRDSEWHFYPNPFKEIVHIEFEREVQQISIMDANGKIVFERHWPDKKIEINLGDLQSGTYVAVLKDKNEKTTYKKAIKL